MSDEKEPVNEPANAAPNTSENIEVPKEKPPGTWEMPKPVFQQSSGFLPQGFEKRFPKPDAQAEVPTDEPVSDGVTAAVQAAAAAPSADAETPAPPPAIEVSESPNIQPQPDVKEEFTLDEAPSPAPAKKKRSPAVRITLAILGILAMIAFVIIFLGVVYYLFFYQPSDPQILN